MPGRERGAATPLGWHLSTCRNGPWLHHTLHWQTDGDHTGRAGCRSDFSSPVPTSEIVLSNAFFGGIYNVHFITLRLQLCTCVGGISAASSRAAPNSPLSASVEAWSAKGKGTSLRMPRSEALEATNTSPELLGLWPTTSMPFTGSTCSSRDLYMDSHRLTVEMQTSSSRTIMTIMKEPDDWTLIGHAWEWAVHHLCQALLADVLRGPHFNMVGQ